MSETAAVGADIVILLPLYNDWGSLRLLLAELDSTFTRHGLHARVIVVDDGSSVAPEDRASWGPYQGLVAVEVLPLLRNLGHQRAIAVGLCYVEAHVPCRAIVLMDSDGEDAPGDVPRLLARFEEEAGRKLVFAERTKRSESWVFVVFYTLYRWAHILLTGREVRIGNFSAIPQARLRSLAAVSELWNHYPAAVLKSQQPYCTVPTVRGKRLVGKSHMNFERLVIHGLSAISVFSDVVGVRLLIATFVLLGVAVAGIGATAAIRFFTTLAVPGWATYTVGIFLIIMLQTLVFSILFSFVILIGRIGATFIPSRDYSFFVGEPWMLYLKS